MKKFFSMFLAWVLTLLMVIGLGTTAMAAPVSLGLFVGAKDEKGDLIPNVTVILYCDGEEVRRVTTFGNKNYYRGYGNLIDYGHDIGEGSGDFSVELVLPSGYQLAEGQQLIVPLGLIEGSYIELFVMWNLINENPKDENDDSKPWWETQSNFVKWLLRIFLFGWIWMN